MRTFIKVVVPIGGMMLCKMLIEPEKVFEAWVILMLIFILQFIGEDK